MAGLQRRCPRQSQEVNIAFDVGLRPVGAELWRAVRQMDVLLGNSLSVVGYLHPPAVTKATCEADNCRGRLFVRLYPSPRASSIPSKEMGVVPILKRLGHLQPGHGSVSKRPRLCCKRLLVSGCPQPERKAFTQILLCAFFSKLGFIFL